MFTTVVGYFIRHIYRLFKDSLLTNHQNLGPEEMDTLINQRKQYRELNEETENTGNTCPICFEDF